MWICVICIQQFQFLCFLVHLLYEQSFSFLLLVPPQVAKATAASLPLGNISPYNNCQSVKISPSAKSADVPETASTNSRIIIFYVVISTQCSSMILSTTQHVIIFVRLAISSETFDLQERIS